MGCSSSNLSPVCHNEELSQDFHDKYLLGVKLGRGAFAQVRVATKLDPQALRPGGKGGESANVTKDRAVKILDLRDKNTPSEPNRQLIKAAHNEAVVWKVIGNHPNCIRLQDVFFSNEFCYMVMEKCSSGLLQALEAMPELTERGLGNIFAQMLCGIVHCHGVRVVHRDVKPDNFLVGGDDGQVVKLGDFGLSATMPKQGKLPGVFGTAPFMCPEMLAGRSYDEKADVWSFGVIVYVLLFGQFPYMPKEQSSKGMKQAITEGNPPPKFEPMTRATGPNSQMRSDTAVEFVKTVLNRDPERRPTAEECMNFTWMQAVMQSRHMPDTTLPSLRPMLHAAKKVGAFEVRDATRDTTSDALLNQRQMERHGKPLPPTTSQSTKQPKKEDPRSASKPKKPPHGSNNWENQSNTSTAAGSSELNGSNSDAFGGYHKGSGWSKDTHSVGTNS